MLYIDDPSYKVVAANVTRLAERFKIEERNWPKISRVYYAAANQGILPHTLESLRLIRWIALLGTNDYLVKRTDYQ